MVRLLAATTIAAAALSLAACDNKADTTSTPAAAPAAAPTATPAATPSASTSTAAPAAVDPADAARAKLAAMMNVYPDEAAWTKACTEDKVDAKICECAGKATVKTVGAKGLYAWVWQGYVNRDSTARMRSNRWFTDNKIDKADQQKFADAIGKCYTL
jgi:hypothetical protein